MLTEQQIARSWQRLFTRGGSDEKVVAKAEAMLAELRPESPLRHRLSAELEEFRKLSSRKVREISIPGERTAPREP